MVDHSAEMPVAPLLRTPLYALHVELGARMVPFAGYDMPVQYPAGIIAEHQHTRAAAGLFDVSHMGQAMLSAPHAARLLERLVPADIIGLADGRMRYSMLLDDAGTILDDLIVTRLAAAADGGERLFLVVNAATKAADFAHIKQRLPQLDLTPLEDRALIALQGPKAVAVLERHVAGCAALPFMSMRSVDLSGTTYFISRSGYTGEDGFEISTPAGEAEAFARKLLAEPEVKPIGLGARDSLRLEAGLCLYGHDIDTTTTPVEAGLVWSIAPRRREAGGFPGDDRIRQQIANRPARRRVGVLPVAQASAGLGQRQPAVPIAREGCELADGTGKIIGRVTSGGFSPTLGHPIAMAYVDIAHSTVGTELSVIVRGKPVASVVTPMPFVPHHYFKS